MPDRTDQNTVSGRVKRYARVGRAMGGVAAKYAGRRYLGVEIDDSRYAEELKAALGGLKGPLMKVAQILSTVPDALPDEYAEQLAELQTNAPSMGWPFVKRRMTSELGSGWRDRFEDFERQAAAAASLGQVHRARGKDGVRLACKLQYPDMASAVEADLKQLKLAFAIHHRYDRAIDPSQIHAELSARMREELDYAREAAHMRLYADMLSGEASVHVPEVQGDLSTGRLLTMTWLDGEPLVSFVDEHAELRNTVARNMFRAWYSPLYNYGVIHGDPHLGNYTVRPEGDVNLLDFGCIRVFRAPFVRAVIDLYHALLNDDKELEVHAYETWGFNGLDREVIDILNHWARFIYGPLMTDKVQPISEMGSTTYGAKVAAKVHRELRRVGGVTPPREFVLMDRAAIGLGGVFMRLKAEINWREMFHALVEGFEEAALEQRQAHALERHSIPAPV